jgi:hypothetical protein
LGAFIDGWLIAAAATARGQQQMVPGPHHALYRDSLVGRVSFKSLYEPAREVVLGIPPLFILDPRLQSLENVAQRANPSVIRLSRIPAP